MDAERERIMEFTLRNSARKKNDWIGVDLDRTLAYYEDWISVEHIGDPIPDMLSRVKRWIADGVDVRIFTARAFPSDTSDQSIKVIETWCKKHIGIKLPVVYSKDQHMIELWDDRAVQVIPNTGKRIDGVNDD
jgi:hypothetical protein